MNRPEPFDPMWESPRVSTAPTDDPWKLDYADIEGEPLHLRNYAVRAYRLDPERILLRGVVDDRKSGAGWIPWDDATVVMHHMVLDLVVEYPSLVILDARLMMEAHPHQQCITIESKYRELIGVSVARGFTHKVREMFGGPRGCTHTTALLQAMAPVAVQTTWGMAMANRREAAAAEGRDISNELPSRSTEEDRQSAVRFSLNSCHVWDEEGPVVAQLRSGSSFGVPLPIHRRMVQHGIDPTREL